MAKPDTGEIQQDGVHCRITIRSFPHQIVVLVISGTDIGEFGLIPMRGLEAFLLDARPIQLFIDARQVRGASIEVSGDRANWMAAHKENLRRVTMLPGSRLVEMTADFVRRFAELHGVMRIYKDAKPFDADLAESLRGN